VTSDISADLMSKSFFTTLKQEEGGAEAQKDPPF